MESNQTGTITIKNSMTGIKDAIVSPRIQSQLSRIKDVLYEIHQKIYRLNDLHSNVSIEARYDELPPSQLEDKRPVESIEEKLSDVEDSLLIISGRLESMNQKLSGLI